jgi:hypothetical protein
LELVFNFLRLKKIKKVIFFSLDISRCLRFPYSTGEAGEGNKTAQDTASPYRVMGLFLMRKPS